MRTQDAWASTGRQRGGASRSSSATNHKTSPSHGPKILTLVPWQTIHIHRTSPRVFWLGRIGTTKCSQSNLTPKNPLDHHGNQQHDSVISRTYHTLICFLYHFGRSGSAHLSVHLSGPSTTTQSVMTLKQVPHTLTPRSFMIGLSSL